MSANPLLLLADYDQSVWYDNIQRSMLHNGALSCMIADDGLKGMTSNPAIFEKAISGSHEYDAAINRLVQTGRAGNSTEVFYHLAIEDIQNAADIFRKVYESSSGLDGYVSLEVSPRLARDTEGTVKEALELAKRVNRPNLMIKVPATREGLPAIERLTAEGISVNATLLFSVERYRETCEAYLRGLETRLRNKQNIANVASVASFFVSRVDGAVDKLLEQRLAAGGLRERIEPLLGRAAIANAKIAYQVFQQRYGTPRFAALRAGGARPQRLLWASTGTKNPKFSDVIYIEELIGPQTVSTIPPSTYSAFKNHGQLRSSLEENVNDAHALLAALAEHGIDLKAVTDQLEDQGVKLFADAFTSLLSAIDTRLGGSAPRASNA